MAESLESLLERVASSAPTPGGGSASAMFGAFSVALSRMVVNLAIGKQGYEAVQGELTALESRATTLQAKFLALAEEDAKAYEAVVAARRMPRASDEDRAVRKEAMQAAYKGAAEVPLETMRGCVEALEIAREGAEKGNRSAITDAGGAAIAAQAGLRGAALNVRINLTAIADGTWRGQREEALASLMSRGAELAHAVDDSVESRM